LAVQAIALIHAAHIAASVFDVAVVTDLAGIFDRAILTVIVATYARSTVAEVAELRASAVSFAHAAGVAGSVAEVAVSL
jgi:hypothetical protein